VPDRKFRAGKQLETVDTSFNLETTHITLSLVGDQVFYLFSFEMTTLLPPPKRQKSAYSQSLKPPPPPTSSTPVPSVVVHFRSAEDGSSLGPAINLSADTGRDALQMLVNKLRGEVSSRYSY